MGQASLPRGSLKGQTKARRKSVRGGGGREARTRKKVERKEKTTGVDGYSICLCSDQCWELTKAVVDIGSLSPCLPPYLSPNVLDDLVLFTTRKEQSTLCFFFCDHVSLRGGNHSWYLGCQALICSGVCWGPDVSYDFHMQSRWSLRGQIPPPK